MISFFLGLFVGFAVPIIVFACIIYFDGRRRRRCGP